MGASRAARVTPALWFAGGGCWVAQLFLAWTTSGPLSASTMTDGFRLVRSGAVDSTAAPWTAWLLVLLPLAGLALAGSAGFGGGVLRAGRLVVALLGALVVLACVQLLTGFEPARLGPGGWASVVGLALVAVAAALPSTRAGRPYREDTGS